MKMKLYRLRNEMKESFGAIKKNPMDLNRIMDHIAKLSQAMDILMSDQIGDDFMFDLHMEMLGSPPTSGGSRPQVSDLKPWRELGRTVKAGNEVDLSKVPLSKLHFWSDQHFQHKNIIEYSKRPYGDLDHMHAQFIRNYKQVVKPDDICVWIGDVSFAADGKTNAWLKEFPGYKVLVVGNHDIDHGKLKNLDFDEIHTSITFDQFVVTHHPWTGHLPDNMWNIHGHTHDRVFEADRHICACVEMINYVPISMLEIQSRIGRAV